MGLQKRNASPQGIVLSDTNKASEKHKFFSRAIYGVILNIASAESKNLIKRSN